MDKTQHKIAMEFFRSEIKTLAERLSKNKAALRHNHRVASKGLNEPTKEYDKTGTVYKYYSAESIIDLDRHAITALHILYGELRGKPHLPEEKKEEYVSTINADRKRMEKYIKEKQDALVLDGAASTGGV